MVKTAIQLFTLKDVDEPIPALISRVGETKFDGVELYDAQLDAFEDDEILEQTVEALEEADLEVVATHIGVDRLESSMDETVEICRGIDCSTLVIPTYDSEAFASYEGITEAANRMDGLAADLEDAGIDLLYHNHTFEFTDLGDENALEAFVSRTERVGFEPDVGLATHAGDNPLALLEATAGRAPIVHLTDSDPTDPDALHADVGDGVVDIDACAAAAAEHGAAWFVCENGRTDDGLASLAHGSEAFDRLRTQVTSEH